MATATICSAPTSRATVAWVRTTSAVSSILSAGIAPPTRRLLPIRVKARWVTSSRSCPLPASATSSRVVLLPMSMQAQIKQWRGCELRVRGVLELPEQAGDDEGGLLADVDGVVADALDAAGHEHHVHRPFARVGVVADLERQLEDVAVQPVDLVVLAHEVLGQGHVAAREGLLALDHLRARLRAHPLDVVEHPRVGRAARGRRAARAWPCSRTGRPCARCA